MKVDVAKLTRNINLLANHWRGDPTTLLYRRFDQRVTYQTAVSRCKSMGGNIAAKVLRDVDSVRYFDGPIRDFILRSFAKMLY